MPSMTMLSRVLVVSGAALCVATPLTLTLPATSAAAAVSNTHWVGGPFPAASGTGLSRNEDGEPGIGVTPTGQVWVASDIAPYAAKDPRVSPQEGLLSGADIWSSSNGGASYKWNSDPFSASTNSFGLAGEDTDLAVATAKNSTGNYNIYATSLWVGASGLALSTDGGKTWSFNPLGGKPTQDRPWLAADGACTFYLAYHQLPLFTPVIDKYDACTQSSVPTQTGAALDPVGQTLLTASDFPGLSNTFNKIWVDSSPTSKHQHNVYVPMTLCKVEGAADLVTNANAPNCPLGSQYLLAVSTDGGQTFSYHPVALDKSGATLVWAATVGTDAAGTVYYAWSDSKDSFLDISHDGGVTWTARKKLNAPRTSAVYPTVAGGVAGRVDIAWYGTTRAGNSNDTKVMGKPNAPGSASWTVDVARSTNSGSTFTIRTVSGTIHRGELCTHGSGCGDTNSRNLLDDFGLAISPTTGLDVIAYTNDQPEGQAGTAYTGFLSELANATRSGSGSVSVRGSGSSRGTGSSLAATGGGLLPAAAGAALIAAGLYLRRRHTRET